MELLRTEHRGTAAHPSGTAAVHNVIRVESAQHFWDCLRKYAFVLLYFGASWCKPCKTLEPSFNKLSVEYGAPRRSTTIFLKIDINDDNTSELVHLYKVTSIPTTLSFRNGIQVGEVVGNKPGHLQLLVKHLHESF